MSTSIPAISLIGSLRARYKQALKFCLGGDEEQALFEAYEIGRLAYAGKLSVGEMMRMHHEVLADLGPPGATLELTSAAMRLGAELFSSLDSELVRLRDYQTEQRALNDRLRKQTAMLDHANEALRVAKANAEAAARVKADFLANMSHEIRTPMNAVIGMTSLLIETELNQQQLDFTQTIRSSGEHLLTVINDILDFSKIESGGLSLEIIPFSIRTCIEEALDLIAVRASQKNLDLAYMISHRTPEGALGDAGRVRQILLNLLSNAVKFTEKGEVVVHLSSRPLDDGRHEFHLAVRDTGIGIPADRFERLFQAFSQVDVSTTRLYGGTGLGLAITKTLSELMGGRAWAESQPGKGSTFHVTFLAQPVAQKVRTIPLAPEPELYEKRVLIVDDNATNRRVLSYYVQAWGMKASVASSGSETLEILAQGESFDVALLDYIMPEMDGGVLASEIRNKYGPALPLMLITSLTSPRVIGGHFAGVFKKPIKPTQVLDALKSLFSQNGAKRAEREPGFSISSDLGTKHPLRILVAEDNVVNQKVAGLFLSKLGYQADFVANGQEAIDAVVRQQYDVLLMDVQMPILDGISATREICRRFLPLERPRIVAMTAHAMSEDQQQCLEAGMDDYASKPVTLESLAHTLLRCAAMPTRPAVISPAIEVKPLSLSGVEAAASSEEARLLSRHGSAELMRFRDTAAVLLRALRQAADLTDAENGQARARELRELCEKLTILTYLEPLVEIENMSPAQFTREAIVKVAQVQKLHANLLLPLGKLLRSQVHQPPNPLVRS